MITAIVMPKLGETMESGKLIKWHKQVGDPVERGDVLFEVETDKTTFEVEAPKQGFLRSILVAESDEQVPVTVTVGYIAKKMDEPLPEVPETGPKAAREPAPVVAEGPSPENDEKKVTPKTGRIRISPLARRLAKEKGLDPAIIAGSGPDGKIVARDIKGAPSDESPRPLSRVRKITAERMTHSKTTVPHFYLFHSVDMTKTLALYGKIKEEISRKYSVKLTITDLVVSALAGALKDFPGMNASYQDNGVAVKEQLNIGLAAATDSELFVPVIKNAGSLNVTEIAIQRSMLTEKTRAGKLRPDDLEGGTFTLSNLGNTGLEGFVAIINPPQTGILATGTIFKKPVVRNEQIEIADVMEVALSCDHRVVNGMEGARFLLHFVWLLENPHTLLTAGYDL